MVRIFHSEKICSGSKLIFRELKRYMYVSRGGSRIPRRKGRQPSGGGGGGEAPTYEIAKFSEKLHEIEKILGRRGARGPCAPLNPPLVRDPAGVGSPKLSVTNYKQACIPVDAYQPWQWPSQAAGPPPSAPLVYTPLSTLHPHTPYPVHTPSAHIPAHVRAGMHTLRRYMLGYTPSWTE